MDMLIGGGSLLVLLVNVGMILTKENIGEGNVCKVGSPCVAPTIDN